MSIETYTESYKNFKSVMDKVKNGYIITEDDQNVLARACEAMGTHAINPMRDIYDNGDSVGYLVSEMVNTCSPSEYKASFIKYITSRMHRYLQSEFFDVILSIIKTWGTNPDHMFDGRNKYVGDTCRKIVEDNADVFEYVKNLEELKAGNRF